MGHMLFTRLALVTMIIPYSKAVVPFTRPQQDKRLPIAQHPEEKL